MVLGMRSNPSWHGDSSSAARVGVAQIEGHDLQRVARQVVVIVQQHVVRRSRCALPKFDKIQ